MLAANQGQNSSRGLPRCSWTLMKLMPFCSTSSARGAVVGVSTGVSWALVMVGPFRKNLCNRSCRIRHPGPHRRGDHQRSIRTAGAHDHDAVVILEGPMQLARDLAAQ